MKEPIASTPASDDLLTNAAAVHQLLAVVNQLPTAIAILQGPQHVYTFANPLYAKITGRTQKQLIGKPIREVFPQIEEQGILNLCDAAFATGQPYTANELTAAFKNDDGQHMERSNFSIQPINDDEGVVTGLILYAHSVTKEIEGEKKVKESILLTEAQAAAEKQKRLYEAVNNNTPDLMYVFSLDYRFTYANNALLTMWGCNWEYANGRGLRELGYEEWHAAMHEEEIDQVATTGKPIRGEVSFPHATLGKRIYDYIFAPIFNEAGEVEAVAGTTRDISDIKAAENAIKVSESYFRQLTDTVPVIIWITEPDGSCSYLNKHWYEFTGQTEEEAEGFGWLDAAHPDDKDEAAKIFVDANEQQKPFSLLYRLRTRHGDYRWAKDNGSPKYSTEGVYEGFVGTVVDVHEEKLAEEKLKQSEAQFKNITETIPQLVWVCNNRGEVIYFNDKWYQFTGKGPAESLGHKWSQLLHPDDVANALEKWNESQRTATPLSIEYRLQTADGGYRWVFSRGVPIKNSDGTIDRWFGTCTDIHEQKNIEYTLRESQSRFQNLVRDASAAIIVVTGAEMKVEIVNEAYGRLINLKSEDLLGKPLFSMIPQAKEYYLPLLEKVRTTGESLHLYDSPYTVLVKNEQIEGFLHVVYQPYRDAAGAIIGVMAILQDVTESVKAKKALEESEANLQQQVAERTKDLAEANLTLQEINKELVRSNQNLEEFAHAASHDLKEPIRKIHFFTNQLKQQLGTRLNDNEGKLFNRIENATERMGALVDDLLLYSHVSQRPAEKEPVDLAEKIKRVLEDLEVDVQEKAAVIKVEKLPIVQGYRRQLQQMFQNLISNALKYTKPGEAPQIHVFSLLKEKGGRQYYCITVADNGIGFAQEYAEKIFQMFTRLHGKTEYSGTGVGLSIVKKVVENHDGFIEVESVPEKGATFRIYLPV